jgi:hypothetical protein
MYFQTLVPFFVLYQENRILEQSIFLAKWNELDDSPLNHFVVPNISISDPELLKRNLLRNNIFVVAQRRLNDMVCTRALYHHSLFLT